MKNVILLTGFTFFNKYFLNPSEEVVKALDKVIIKNYRVVSAILPVSFKKP